MTRVGSAGSSSACEICRIVQWSWSGVLEVHHVDRRDGAARDVGGRHLHAQADRAEDRQFRARVVAFDVVGGIGLGVAKLLRPGQRIGKGGAGRLHAGEDVVAGAVEDAGDPLDAVARDAVAQGADHGDAAGDGRFKAQVPPLVAGQPQQLAAVVCDELFVGRDDRAPGLESAAHPRTGGVASADELDDDVGVRREHRLDVVGPHDVGRHPVGALAGDVAVEDVREADAGRRPLGEDLRHRAAHRAKPQ